MRQIHVCAWLLVASWSVAACSGEKFTASDSPASDTPAETGSAGKASNSRAGSSNGTSAGSAQMSMSGKPTSGGATGAGGAAGATASGGAFSSAGSYSVGGGEASGGASSEECPSGAITFRMLPGPDLAPDYLCDAGCGTGWLTITDAEGATAFSIFSACGTASCESCEMLPCAAAACMPTPLTTDGSQLVWNGTYLAKDTCGANMACQRQACVKPGKYKAKACAAISAGPSGNGIACAPKTEMLCAQAEFDFPATATVKLVLKK